jgi:hypothetical protein
MESAPAAMEMEDLVPPAAPIPLPPLPLPPPAPPAPPAAPAAAPAAAAADHSPALLRFALLLKLWAITFRISARALGMFALLSSCP